MPLMACSTAPPRPCQNVDCRRISVVRSGSSARASASKGHNSRIAPATSAPDVKQLPQPLRPESATTSTRVCKVLLRRFVSLRAQPPSDGSCAGEGEKCGRVDNLHAEGLRVTAGSSGYETGGWCGHGGIYPSFDYAECGGLCQTHALFGGPRQVDEGMHVLAATSGRDIINAPADVAELADAQD